MDMHVPEQAHRLRVYLGESDRHHGTPTYEAIVKKARELHLAGATVLRGPMGFGGSSRIHTAKLLQLSEDLPMVVEIVDHKDKLDGLLPFIDKVLTEGLATLEPVQVVHYRHRPSEG